jgi:NAD(P)-dependent dehydrogenase (short-subunit alcohol dehydrogenase family)
MNPISGRCIWITGASSGLGRALAQQLAAAGNFVIASARSHKELQSLCLEYPKNIALLPLDVSKALEMQTARQQLQQITDYLDMVICAAGICEYEDNLSFDPERYARTMDVNFLGVVRLFNLALPLLKKSHGRAHFVAISSLSSCVGLPRAEAYGASKAALNYFMQSLKADMVKLNIDFSLVRPGFIASPLTAQNDFPMPFIMTPEAASHRIINALAERKFLIDFPRRLSWLLRFFGWAFPLWCKWVSPKITRLHSW